MNMTHDNGGHPRDWAGRTRLHHVVIDGPDDVNHVTDDPARIAQNYRREAEHRVANTRKLLDAGYDVNARDNDGWTPLHMAAQFEIVEVVELLLDNGADIEAENNKGETPLMIATCNGEENVMQLLRNRGADPFHAANDGFTPVSFAKDIVAGSPVRAVFADLLDS